MPLTATGGESHPAAGLESGAASDSRRRRWPWTVLALLVLVAVVLLVSLTSSGSSKHQRRASGASRAASAASPRPKVRPATGAPLVALPGGPTRAAGTVTISRRGTHVNLHLSVRNLAPAAQGHYEVWLYDTLVYSEALGRLRTGVSDVVLRLPPNASRFHWIDVSFQPAGHVFNSGESVLRSANPLFAAGSARH